LPENGVILEKVVQLGEDFFKQKTLMMAKQKGTRNLAYEVNVSSPLVAKPV